MIQAQNSTTGQDIEYVVFIDCERAAFNEEVSSNARYLEIPFKGDQSKIEIVGTWMVPEFPASAIILGVSIIVGMLLKRRLSFCHTRQ